MKADKDNWIGKVVEEGEYYFLAKTPWKSFVNEFSVSVYGPGTTDIQQIQLRNLPKNFLQEILLSHARQDKSNQSQKFTQQGYPEISYKTFDNRGGFGYIYFNNKSKDVILEATVEFLGSINIKIIHPFSGLRPSIVILPGESDLIPYEAKTLPYSTQMRIMTCFKNS